MENEKLIDLVQKAQQGDTDAMDGLFTTYYNDVYYFALKTVKDSDLACDITQETFLEIIRTIGNLKEPLAFVTWMKQIAYHQCTRHFNKRKDVLVEEDEDGNTVFDTLADEGAMPAEILEQEEFRQTILSMIEELTEEQRSAVLLYYFDELTVGQIAQIQGVSEGTVKSRLNYARKAIKKSVETYEEKHNIKLHSFAMLPLLMLFFGKAAMPEAKACAMRSAVAGATKTAAAAAATITKTTAAKAAGGTIMKIASWSIGTKIAAAVAAVALTVGAGVGISAITSKDQEKPNDTNPTQSIEATTPEQTPTEKPSTSETTPATTPTVNLDEEPGSNFKYKKLSETTAEITRYTGTNKAFRIPAQIDGYKIVAVRDGTFYFDTSLTSVAIPGSVTSIGPKAFYSGTGLTGIWVDENNPKYSSDSQGVLFNKDKTELVAAPGAIKSYTIPDSVTSIGVSAFARCTGLTSITIPNSVTSIGSSAFFGCTGLTDIAIPDSVTSIGSMAFNGCTGFTSVTIPDSVTSIAQSVFFGCTGLTGVTIPDSVTSIDGSAFTHCTSLINIVIPDSITYIGGAAFQDCTGLTTVAIPDSVTRIEEFAFRGCTSLTGIWVDKNNPNYSSDSKGVLFNKDKTELVAAPGAIKSYTIPDSVTSIGLGAFARCTGLTEITIPNSVTKIRVLSFEGCTGLTSITIPDGVTSISGSVFEGCTGLTSITIPDSVTSIETEAFNGCTGLTEITIPDSVTSIGDGAFSGCTGLTSVTIPDSVTGIRGSAFEGCTALTSISYTGTVAEWKSLSKYELWNFAVPARFVQCMDGQVKF